MPNTLIRDPSQEAVDRIDADAANQRLFQNEFVRRIFELYAFIEPSKRGVTAEDWKRSAETFADLADRDLMSHTWR